MNHFVRVLINAGTIEADDPRVWFENIRAAANP
jgi:hypothetical protein